MTRQADTDSVQMWFCTKYGVAMSAAYAAVFCARRFAAANGNDAARISFGRCRTCSRGAAEYRLAKRNGVDIAGGRTSFSRD